MQPGEVYKLKNYKYSIPQDKKYKPSLWANTQFEAEAHPELRSDFYLLEVPEVEIGCITDKMVDRLIGMSGFYLF